MRIQCGAGAHRARYRRYRGPGWAHANANCIVRTLVETDVPARRHEFTYCCYGRSGDICWNITTDADGQPSLPLPAFDIAVDGDGRLLIAGATFSGDLPRHSGTAISWSGMAFAARLDPDHPSGPRYDYVNYFTGNGDDRATAISPGVSGDAYVCGRTSSTDFPAWSGAFDWKPPTAGSAGFVLHLDTNGQLRRTSFIKAAETTTIFDCTFADASAGKPGLYVWFNWFIFLTVCKQGAISGHGTVAKPALGPTSGQELNLSCA
jgi:hypothetical protein